MAIKIYQPTTPARRHTSVLMSDDITAKKPFKKLVVAGKNMAGRNNQFDVPAVVETIEYDPNRNSRIALLNYADGERRYIIAPQELKVGEKIMSSQNLIDLKIGNTMPLLVVPPGMFVYNVEITPGKGGQLARSAGNAIYLMGLDSGYAQLKMPSGEVRLIPEKCLATIGAVSNPDYKNIRWGKAGRMRNRGIRPTVRGKAMNPVDHPHGGGEGNNPIGLKNPKTPWGKPALGVKTRRKQKSDSLIISRRNTKKNK